MTEAETEPMQLLVKSVRVGGHYEKQEKGKGTVSSLDFGGSMATLTPGLQTFSL